MSLVLVKHSSTRDGEETTSVLRTPKRSNITGPNLREKLRRVSCRGCFSKGRWPRIGIEGGLGGRFDDLFLFLNSLKIIRRVNISKTIKLDEFASIILSIIVKVFNAMSWI